MCCDTKGPLKNCQCACQCDKCKPQPLNFEVGKTYLTERGSLIKIVGLSSRGEYIGEVIHCKICNGKCLANRYPEYNKKGQSINSNISSNLIEEYKEPVVHEREIVLMRHGKSGPIEWNLVRVGDKFNWTAPWAEIYRQTVQYTEE